MTSSLLLDTHILIRWLGDQKRLSREQKRVLEGATRRSQSIAISAMSLLELSALVADNDISLDVSLDDFLGTLQESHEIEILPISIEVAAEFAYLAVLRDPADRAIVATARANRLKLVTSDQRIVESKLVPVID